MHRFGGAIAWLAEQEGKFTPDLQARVRSFAVSIGEYNWTEEEKTQLGDAAMTPLPTGDETKADEDAREKRQLKILKKNVKTFQINDDHDGWTVIKYHLKTEFLHGQQLLEECMEVVGLELVTDQDSYHPLETVIQQRLRR